MHFQKSPSVRYESHEGLCNQSSACYEQINMTTKTGVRIKTTFIAADPADLVHCFNYENSLASY